MTKVLLLAGASVRTRLRWARQHIYSWLILAPIVLGLSYATVARLASDVSLSSLQPTVALTLAALFEVLLIATSLSRAADELYCLRRPESQFEALPISAVTHLHSALLIRLARTAVAGGVVLAITSRFDADQPSTRVALLSLGVFIVLTALAEELAALNWIHWGHRRERLHALQAVVTVLSTALLAAFCLLDAVNLYSPQSDSGLWLTLSAVSVVMLYILLRISHSRWRTSDLEYARRLEQSGRRGVSLVRALTRRFSPVVGAQLARDLQLTLRGFSSAVYVALAFAVLWPAVLISLLTTDALPLATEGIAWLDATWLPAVMAIKIACVLATVSISALVPVLLGYELPHFWLERAVGATGLDMWQAKLWYARLVSAPAPLVVWMAGLLTAQAPLFYALPMLAECLWLWWLVSSIIGALSFEMPARVGLGIVMDVIAGLAAGVLASMAWPVGLLIYAQAMHSLTARGRIRARYYLMMGED